MDLNHVILRDLLLCHEWNIERLGFQEGVDEEEDHEQYFEPVHYVLRGRPVLPESSVHRHMVELIRLQYDEVDGLDEANPRIPSQPENQQAKDLHRRNRIVDP